MKFLSMFLVSWRKSFEGAIEGSFMALYFWKECFFSFTVIKMPMQVPFYSSFYTSILMVFSIFISRISGRDNRIGPGCLSVWVCKSYIMHHAPRGYSTAISAIMSHDVTEWHHGRVKGLWNAQRGRCFNAGAFSYSLKSPFYSWS